MEHEVRICLLSIDCIKKLFILNCSQCCHCKRLCLTACEECRAMSARKHTDFACNRADLSDLSAICSHAVIEN